MKTLITTVFLLTSIISGSAFCCMQELGLEYYKGAAQAACQQAAFETDPARKGHSLAVCQNYEQCVRQLQLGESGEIAIPDQHVPLKTCQSGEIYDTKYQTCIKRWY